MSKKIHIGHHGTPRCTRGLSMHRAGTARPSITVSLEEFKRLAPAMQCQRCAKSIDTSDFARELGERLFGV